MSTRVNLSCLLVMAMAMPACADLYAQDTRPSHQQEYWAQFDRKDWPAAVAAAQGLIAEARQAEPMDALQLAEALTLLGEAQTGSGDFVAAESAYAEALQLVQANAAPTSTHLLAPLGGLARLYARTERHPYAVPLFEQAVLITRRSYGLFDLSQLSLLRQLAASLTELNLIEDAARHMNYVLRVGERNYGGDDPRIVPLITSVADWHMEAGSFTSARQLYHNALAVVEERLGETHPAAVTPLRGIARSHTQELHFALLRMLNQRERFANKEEFGQPEPRRIHPRMLNEQGGRALERALQILANQDQSSAAEHIATLIQAGDWYIIKQEPEKALTYYQRALRIPAEQPELSGQARLSFPVRIFYPVPPLAAASRMLAQAESEERYIEMEFTVAADGAVSDVREVSSTTNSRQRSEAIQTLLASRYRPRFVAGQAVATPAMKLREVYRVRKKRDDAQE